MTPLKPLLRLLRISQLSVFMIIFGLIGLISLLLLHAATPTVNVEVESGAITGNATVLTDTTASGTGNTAVKFGASTSVTPYGSIPGTWSLVFDDEFNNTTLDTNKWNVEGPRSPNNSQEQDCYAPSAVSVGSGALNIAILNTPCTVGGNTWPYTGGQLDSHGHFDTTYGYFEAHVYVPGSGGKISNWPAWWLVGQSWPADGEIDQFEGYMGGAGWHYMNSSQQWQGSYQSQDYTGWHIYAVNWQANKVTYYYDGVQVGQITSGLTTSLPLHLMLDNTTAPEGNVGGPQAIPAIMKVDYVRVWK